MNKYEHALNRIAFNYGISALEGQTNKIMDEKFGADIGVLQELIEKATPKKPIMYRPRTVERPYCGHCSLRLKKTWIVCPRCGTVIDWSEDDEES